MIGAPGTPPMQGVPVTGLVPTAVSGPAVVPGSVPGVLGETGTSGCYGSVSELDRFCAGAIAA